jgi:hypothetical protein
MEKVMTDKPFAGWQSPCQAGWLGSFVAAFIHDQKNLFISTCRPLRPRHLELMAPHFKAVDLERALFRNIYPDRVANPAFYAGLQAVGFACLPDFGWRRASTFDTVIVTHEPLTPAMLFHELVHVVQYRLLGVEGFATTYVQALLAGDSYGFTRLEACADAMEERFLRGSGPIDVEREVKQWLAADRPVEATRVLAGGISWHGVDTDISTGMSRRSSIS